MDNTNSPQISAVALIPAPEERKRRERLLAKLLVITLDMVVREGHIDLSVKIDAAKDVIREFIHVYPEAMNV